MDADSTTPEYLNLEATAAVSGLAALAQINFGSLDPVDILAVAADGVATLAQCGVEASYRAFDEQMVLCPPSQSERPELAELLQRSNWSGRLELPQRSWSWAFALCHRDAIQGCLVIGAGAEPTEDQFLLLGLLAQQTGVALACAELHQRDVRHARQLEESNETLAGAVQRLEARTHAHELLGAALGADAGEQGIVEALHRLIGRPVCVEDRFGNLRAWAGTGRPQRYGKPTPGQRERFLRLLSGQPGPVRSGGRVCILIKPHSEVFGVLALIDPDEQASDDDLFALQYGGSVLGLEFSHQRNLGELQLNVRRELVDDLLAGTDDNGAYARADALGHDLRRPHYVVVVHSGRGADNTGIAAAGRAAAGMQLNHLLGRHGGLMVLLVDGRPDPGRLQREISRKLGHPAVAIGIGPRCDVPSDFPQSFLKARRALNIRLNSANPRGASAYDELGFYQLVDAAHTAGAADEYARQWLGVLIDYDTAKKSDLVNTLSHYLERGGNYDESARALHVHRSTLRYRLGRIADLTGLDLRNIDTRFNLHAATRVWRFITPSP